VGGETKKIEKNKGNFFFFWGGGGKPLAQAKE